VALPLPLSSELVFIDDSAVLRKRHMNREPG
jgi:hypothetical protein